MEKIENPDFSGAACKVKGYRFTILYVVGYLGIFFPALAFFICYENRKAVSLRTLIIVGIVCGIIAAFAIALLIFEGVKRRRTEKRYTVALYEDGMTVYLTKPEEGYVHFKYEEIEDYGFIHIYREDDCENCREAFTTKHQSADTYLTCDLKNYGYMRITAKDGGYYNVTVGDIETVGNYLKEHTQLKEYRYQRIAGIDDDIIIPLA